MMNFIPLNIYDEASVEYVLSHIDNAVQYGEDLEPVEPKLEDENQDEDDTRQNDQDDRDGDSE